MVKAGFENKGVALVVTCLYFLMSLQAIKRAAHASAGAAYAAMSIPSAILHVVMVYASIMILRRSSNIFEKVMGGAGAGFFIAQFIPYLHFVFPGIQPLDVVVWHLAAALIIIATMALILRTVQMFIESQARDE